jgi:hypothetical protein
MVKMTSQQKNDLNNSFAFMQFNALFPTKGKRYIIKITSQKLDNGQPDKLFNTGRYVAKFDGKYFVIGSLRRRRSLHQVSIHKIIN